MKDKTSLLLTLWRAAKATFKAGKAVYRWCKRYPKLSAFLLITPPMLLFCYILAVASSEHEDWKSRHCRKTGRSSVPNVIVVHEDFPVVPVAQATYEYECDDGSMMWLTY